MFLSYGRRRDLPPQPDCPSLLLREVSLTYPGAARAALDAVSFTVEPGEKVALIGPNGAGKSTLIKVVAGLLHADRGEVLLHGRRVSASRHRTAYVPQRGEVRWGFPVTVAQVVMMGRYPHLGWLRRPGAQDFEAVHRALDRMNLGHLARHQVGQLSGGQQQRVMIARALAQEPDLLLLDEPLNNVDVRAQGLIFDALDQLALEGKTILVSTHDLGTLRTEFGRAIFLDCELIADGAVSEVLNPMLLARAYGITPHSCPPELLALLEGQTV